MNQSTIKRLKRLAKKIHNSEEGNILPEKFIFKALKKDYSKKSTKERQIFLNLLENS